MQKAETRSDNINVGEFKSHLDTLGWILDTMCVASCFEFFTIPATDHLTADALQGMLAYIPVIRSQD